MRRIVVSAAIGLAIAGCGDDSGGNGSADSGSSESTGGSTTLTTTNGSLTGADTSAGTASATESSGGDTTTSTDGSADGTTTSADASGTTSGADTSTSGALSAEGTSSESGDTDGCFGMGGEVEFSYIWVANSVQGTVSKINTYDGIEEGRYYTSPSEDQIESSSTGPSRTSVNLLGDVAVANRHGGITKFAAQAEDCLDINGNGLIDTSTGPDDILPWGDDECMLWFHPTPAAETNEGPRPIGWEAAFDPVTCEVDLNPRLWFGYFDYDTATAFFERVDGNTGVTLDGVDVAWQSDSSYGPYGGGVNKEGDFWATGLGNAPGVKIDSETLTVTVTQPQGASFYGMALDADGEPWVGGCDGIVWHYDEVAGEWENVGAGAGCMRGLQVDTQGRAFIAHNGFPCGMVVVDTVNEQIIENNVPIPGCVTPVGVSIDVEGYVWVVDMGGWENAADGRAYKIDPDTYQVELTVTGLVQPYTYSDMTGAGLALQVMPM